MGSLLLNKLGIACLPTIEVCGFHFSHNCERYFLKNTNDERDVPMQLLLSKNDELGLVYFGHTGKFASTHAFD